MIRFESYTYTNKYKDKMYSICRDIQTDRVLLLFFYGLSGISEVVGICGTLKEGGTIKFRLN